MIVVCYPYSDMNPERVIAATDITTIGCNPDLWPDPVQGVDIDPDAPDSSIEVAKEAYQELISLAGVGDLLIPMTEESLPIVVKAADEIGAIAIGYSAAKACLNKLEQRKRLKSSTFNPQWTQEMGFAAWDRLVVKAPVSCHSTGVRVVYRNTPEAIGKAMNEVFDDNRFYLERYEWGMNDRLGFQWIYEEFCDGDSYEVNGFNGSDPINPVGVFRPIEQIWKRTTDAVPDYSLKYINGITHGAEIISYRKVEHEQLSDFLRDMARWAVKCLGITWSGWCVEIKGPPWKVIEINGRLGYEPEGMKNYYRALGCNTHEVMVRELAMRYRIEQFYHR